MHLNAICAATWRSATPARTARKAIDTRVNELNDTLERLRSIVTDKSLSDEIDQLADAGKTFNALIASALQLESGKLAIAAAALGSPTGRRT